MAQSKNNEIAKILNRIQGFDTYTVISDFFAVSAIAVRNNVDYGKERDSYEQRYLSIVKKYRKEDLEIFAQALGVFMGWIQKAMDGDIPFRDFAGEIYMDSCTSSGKAGQFFTPYHVSHLMAEVKNGTKKRQIAYFIKHQNFANMYRKEKDKWRKKKKLFLKNVPFFEGVPKRDWFSMFLAKLYSYIMRNHYGKEFAKNK